MTRIIGTIEARMGSSRLPGKTMAKIYENDCLLGCVVRRFRSCCRLSDVVVASSIEEIDDPIAEWCEKNYVPLFRGSENDVLDRVVHAAQWFEADAIVQMGADSAYLDFHLVDQLIDYYLQGEFDYVCNDLRLTYPLGIYAHVVRVEKLVELNQRKDLSSKDRSDVVRYIFEHPNTYAILNIEAPLELRHPTLRLTIDYSEDLAQAKDVYNYFRGHLFTTAQVVELYENKPELFEKTKNLIQQSAPFLGEGV